MSETPEKKVGERKILKACIVRLTLIIAILINLFFYEWHLHKVIGVCNITTYNVYVPFFLFSFLLVAALFAFLITDLLTLNTLK